MRLAYWMYNGPAHVGVLRIVSSFKDVHAIMHAPLGDDYFNVMRSMLERERDFTPVTISVVGRQVLGQGSQDKVENTIIRKALDELPACLVLTPTCTSSILQEDLKNFCKRAGFDLNCPVLLANTNHYRDTEASAADKVFLQLCLRSFQAFGLDKVRKQQKTPTPSVNILGVASLGYHNDHDCRELKRFLMDHKIEVNLVGPEGLAFADIAGFTQAWFNIVPYRECGRLLGEHLRDNFDMPLLETNPVGVMGCKEMVAEIEDLLRNHFNYPHQMRWLDMVYESRISHVAWFARSVDCQNLMNKTALVYGDATHSAGMAKLLHREMGINVVCAGTFSKEHTTWFKEEVADCNAETIVTENFEQVQHMIEKYKPDAIFGTQMERHIAKRYNIPCCVISSPIHIQNYSFTFKPFLGYEGANVLADLIYNCYTLGMEEHLLDIFGGHDTKTDINRSSDDVTWITENGVKKLVTKSSLDQALACRARAELSDKEAAFKPTSLEYMHNISWTPDAIVEMSKIPVFIRGKIRDRVAKYAITKGQRYIRVDTIYQAREDFDSGDLKSDSELNEGMG